MSIVGIHYNLTQTGAPAVEPLTTDEAKLHLHMTHSAEDALVDSYVVAARRTVEQTLGKQLITATWVLRMDGFITEIELPWSPVQSVTSIAYNDTSGTAQTLTAVTDYTLDVYSDPSRLVPAYSKVWPSTYGHINDVTITYKSGYGGASTDIPDDILHAVRLYVGHFNEHREQFIVGAPIAKFPTAEALLTPYRDYGAL